MKTKTIFKTLALAMLMPAMMLTTACSNDDDFINNSENTTGKGYALPVTINVTRQGDDATRATFDDGTKTLSFSAGDKLFVSGRETVAGEFAGTLTWQSEETFSGTIYTTNEYSGTAHDLLTSTHYSSSSADGVQATLLPAGYGDYGYLTVSGDGCSASLTIDATKAFATSKAAAVEQLSLEQASAYSDGFALAPQNAIINFTAVTGQWGSAPASSSVSLQAGETTVSGSVAPVEGDYSRALAKFAIAVADSETPSSLTLTVDGTSVSLGTHALTAGKIYNQKCANINAISPLIQENEKWLVYGTGEPSGWRLTIAEGATVTLHNVNLNNYAIIAYRGNNTIILADGTTNTIDPGSGVAIEGMMTGDKTLTIKGTGTLIATGGYDAPAIGIQNPEFESCGDITIENTVTLTATAGAGQSKAITTGTGGGTVTIGGVEYPGGANSPFTYPAPPTLADVFTDGAVVGVAVKNTYDTYTVTGTYSGGSYTSYTKSSNDIEEVTMTKDGNNLVVWIKNDLSSECTLTFNTQDNTYTKSFKAGTGAAVWDLSEFVSITVNGTDITSTLTEATPTLASESFDTNQEITTYDGTHFTITCTNGGDSDGIQIANDNTLTITAKNGETITKVEFRCEVGQWYASKTTVTAGTLNWTDGSTTGSIDNVNATTVTMSNSGGGWIQINQITVYYE